MFTATSFSSQAKHCVLLQVVMSSMIVRVTESGMKSLRVAFSFEYIFIVSSKVYCLSIQSVLFAWPSAKLQVTFNVVCWHDSTLPEIA